jgi:hypothetical protein
VGLIGVEHDHIEIIETMKLCMTKAVDKGTIDGCNVNVSLKIILASVFYRRF